VKMSFAVPAVLAVTLVAGQLCAQTTAARDTRIRAAGRSTAQAQVVALKVGASSCPFVADGRPVAATEKR
jgi:hypothetical protein